MANFQNKKLPVSPTVGVNDNPVYNAATGVNGTKMILDFNTFVDAVETEFNGLSLGGGREQLTANRTYYVSTTGNDANDGLAVGTPFASIKKALDAVALLDLNGYFVAIQLADGIYNESANGWKIDLFSLFPTPKYDTNTWNYVNSISFLGNVSNPTAVTIACSINLFTDTIGRFEFFNLVLNAGSAIVSSSRATIALNNVTLAPNNNSNNFISLSNYSKLIVDNLTIYGQTKNLFSLNEKALLEMSNTITFAGLTTSGSFIELNDLSSAVFNESLNYSGSFTGKKFSLKGNSVIRELNTSLLITAIPGTILGEIEQRRTPYRITTTLNETLSRFDGIVEVPNFNTVINLPEKNGDTPYTTNLTIINTSSGNITVRANTGRFIGNDNGSATQDVTVASGQILRLITSPLVSNYWRII